MKQQSLYQKICLLILIIATAFTSNAQEYTFTTSAANIISAKALIDLPGLSGKPDAIIVVTPVGSTLNNHPIGAWYYSAKWNIFNSDFAVMQPGLTYKVQYFLTPGPNQFLHLVTQQSLGAEGTYIDNPALNNKPNAQFLFLQNHSPDIRSGSWLNRFKEKAGYSAAAGKWYIANVGGEAMQQGSAYNIVMNTGGSDLPPNPGGSSCNCPASLPPNGNAGGDLSGTYPNPTVKKLLGNPLSNVPPEIGQVLKWDGAAWVPGEDKIGNAGSVSSIKPSVVFFEQTYNAYLLNPGVLSVTISGLDNQSFVLSQSSRIVFNAHIFVESGDNNIFGGTPTAWLKVEILNASNAVVAWSTTFAHVAPSAYVNINSVGVGILPAGTYHSRVTLFKSSNSLTLSVYPNAVSTVPVHQKGQLIIEIFPD